MGPPPQASSGTLWLLGREAIDAGARGHRSRPHPSDRRDPSRTPRLSSPRSKPPRPVTATAGTTHSPSPSTKASGSSPSTRSKASPSAPPRSGAGPNRLLLLGSAQRLRDETGYQWRFAFEQRAVNAARTNAAEALGGNAEGANAKGRSLNWRAAAAYARRARNERTLPSPLEPASIRPNAGRGTDAPTRSPAAARHTNTTAAKGSPPPQAP